MNNNKTMIEQIFSNHSKDEVKPGNIIWIDLDVRSARDFGGANVVQNLKNNYNDTKIDDINKTYFTFDCVVPANTIPYANNQHICRQYSRNTGVKLFDVDSGIGSHVLIEEGIALPGGTVVGTDSHLNIMGAIGCFGQGMGDQDIAFTFRTGKTWFEVPQSIKLKFTGTYSYPTSAKDLTLAMVGKFGSDGALGYSVDVTGEMLEKLSLSERITLASMATEMGGIILLIEPSKEIIDYYNSKSTNKFNAPKFNNNAQFAKEIEINIDNLEPKIACPPAPENVHNVSDMKGKLIDSVFIGSCTNGQYDDIKKVAEIVKGKKVASGVMAKIVPSTKAVFSRLLKEGILETLNDSGFIISNSGCGGCASGQIGMTGKGEVQLSTSNRNFTGKQGAGDTYLVSPITAAVSALAGKIVSPKDFL